MPVDCQWVRQVGRGPSLADGFWFSESEVRRAAQTASKFGSVLPWDPCSTAHQKVTTFAHQKVTTPETSLAGAGAPLDEAQVWHLLLKRGSSMGAEAERYVSKPDTQDTYCLPVIKLIAILFIWSADRRSRGDRVFARANTFQQLRHGWKPSIHPGNLS